MTTLYSGLVVVGGFLAVSAAWLLARRGGSHASRLRRGLGIWAVYAILVFALSLMLYASDGPQSLTGYGVVWYGCLVSSMPVAVTGALVVIISIEAGRADR